VAWGEGQFYDGNVRKPPVMVGAWPGSAGALMGASYALGEPVVTGLVAVFGVVLPARYWDALRPGMPGFHVKLRFLGHGELGARSTAGLCARGCDRSASA
jgi:hypothetical protein